MISVVICTYNRSRLLKKTLDSVAQLHHPPIPWEVIIVENNCTDNTAQLVRNFATNSSLSVRCVSERKQGISHARIAGINEAQGDIIAFTDDDVILHPQWLCEIHATFNQFDCLGVGGKIIPLWISQKPSWLEMDGPESLMKAVLAFDLGEYSCELNAATAPFGANMSFRRTAFEKYGFFRTDLGRKRQSLMLGEDTEFCLRLLNSGEKLVYAPTAVVYHPVAEERLKKQFFYSWYFHFGRYMARTISYPINSKIYRGVPRYLFKNLLLELLKWLLNFDPKQRFRHRLFFYLVFGQITALYRSVQTNYPEPNQIGEKSIGVREKAIDRPTW